MYLLSPGVARFCAILCIELTGRPKNMSYIHPHAVEQLPHDVHVMFQLDGSRRGTGRGEETPCRNHPQGKAWQWKSYWHCLYFMKWSLHLSAVHIFRRCFLYIKVSGVAGGERRAPPRQGVRIVKEFALIRRRSV